MQHIDRTWAHKGKKNVTFPTATVMFWSKNVNHCPTVWPQFIVLSVWLLPGCITLLMQKLEWSSGLKEMSALLDARCSWRPGANSFIYYICLAYPGIHEACDSAHSWALCSLLGPLKSNAWPEHLEGGREWNDFDICFEYCTASPRIGVCQTSISHELDWKTKHSQRGYGCLVPKCFGTRPLDITVHSMGNQHMLCSYIPWQQKLGELKSVEVRASCRQSKKLSDFVNCWRAVNYEIHVQQVWAIIHNVRKKRTLYCTTKLL